MQFQTMARSSATKGTIGSGRKRSKVSKDDQHPQRNDDVVVDNNDQAVSANTKSKGLSDASSLILQWSTAQVESMVSLLQDQDFTVTAATLQAEGAEALLIETASSTKTNNCKGHWVWVPVVHEHTELSNETSSTAIAATNATTADPATTANNSTRKAPTAAPPTRNRHQSSGESSSESSGDDNDDNDNDSNSDESEDEDKEEKTKATPKQPAITTTKTTNQNEKATKTITKSISPNESTTTSNSDDSDDNNEEDDSSVSDVDVSDVSSVDVSSSEEEEENENESQEDSDDDDSDDSDDDNDDDELIQKRQAKLVAAADQAKAAAAKAAMEWQPKSPAVVARDAIVTTPGSDGAQALNGSGKPFARVDSEYWGQVAQKDGGAMADNSYDAVFSNTGFGAKSNEKLQTVRGKDFAREKNKRKRSFNGFTRNGGRIDTDSSFSTKYVYKD
jgi:SRP40, C-terminal domain